MIGSAVTASATHQPCRACEHPRSCVNFKHCLPFFDVEKNTGVGREIMEQTGTRDGPAENRLYTIEAILVATIGS